MRSEAKQSVDRLVKAAVNWWRGRKPVIYTTEQHLDNPEVNCVTAREKALANAVRDFICEDKWNKHKKKQRL